MKKSIFIILFLILFPILNQSEATLLSGENLFHCNVEIKRNFLDSSVSGSIYMNADYEDLFEDLDSSSRFKSKSLTAPRDGSVASLFSVEDEFRYKIIRLSIPSSSERFGTVFKIDVCYLGPVEQLNIKNNEDLSEGTYFFNSILSSTNSMSSVFKNYSISFSSMCDLRNVGKFREKRKSDIKESASLSEVDALYDSLLGEVKGDGIVFDFQINLNPLQVPRYCKFRYEFSEINREERSSENIYFQPQFFIQIDKIE